MHTDKTNHFTVAANRVFSRPWASGIEIISHSRQGAVLFRI
jgi:hypothetical protein